MPAYDSEFFNPPAPVAPVTLRAIHTGKTVTNVPMLIDSGSDLTLVPEGLVEDLALEVDAGQIVGLESLDGRIIRAKVVEVDLVFLGVTFRGRLPLVSSPTRVLGRNVLNRFPLLLDYPNLDWERISDSRK